MGRNEETEMSGQHVNTLTMGSIANKFKKEALTKVVDPTQIQNGNNLATQVQNYDVQADGAQETYVIPYNRHAADSSIAETKMASSSSTAARKNTKTPGKVEIQ